MIIDIEGADVLRLEGHYDVCIAGGGAAGITLALSLAKRRRRVLVLEGGSRDYSAESQAVYSGTNVGLDYFDLDVCRLRYLGGTSNHWAGWSRPLDAVDFEAHEHIRDSGWPIRRVDVDPYLDEAREILELAPFPADKDLAGSDYRLKEVWFRSSAPVRFGEKYRDLLSASDRIDVLLNANVIDIRFDRERGSVAGLVFSGYRKDGMRQEAKADQYVLALHAIENARMLLHVARRVPEALGPSADHVGRYFMEHPYRDVGYFILGRNDARFHDEFWALEPTDRMIRRDGIANARIEFRWPVNPRRSSVVARAKKAARDLVCESDIITDWIRTIRPFTCKSPVADLPQGAGRMIASIEQVPNPASRITLSDRTDRFGLHAAVLEWRMTPMEKKTFRAISLEAAKYMARWDIGRVKLYDWILDDQPELPPISDGDFGASYHHMGTTRMAASAEDGIVDRDCKLFDVDNLYIAGSSVFRTGGQANPTLTIVQMTLRLADHLASQAPSNSHAGAF